MCTDMLTFQISEKSKDQHQSSQKFTQTSRRFWLATRLHLWDLISEHEVTNETAFKIEDVVTPLRNLYLEYEIPANYCLGTYQVGEMEILKMQPKTVLNFHKGPGLH